MKCSQSQGLSRWTVGSWGRRGRWEQGNSDVGERNHNNNSKGSPLDLDLRGGRAREGPLGNLSILRYRKIRVGV